MILGGGGMGKDYDYLSIGTLLRLAGGNALCMQSQIFGSFIGIYYLLNQVLPPSSTYGSVGNIKPSTSPCY